MDAIGEKQLFKSPIVARFEEMAQSHKAMPGHSDWNGLKTLMEKHYPALRELAVRYDLSKENYHICLLSKLGFSLNDIMYLTECTQTNLSNKRKRMYEKFSEKKGSATDFDHYMKKVAFGMNKLPEV